MAVDTGSIYSDVRIRLDRLRGDVSDVLKEYDKINKGVTQGSEKTQKSVSANFGKMIASIGALAGVQAVIRNVISTFASFEQSMANVASVAGATPEEFEKLTAAAREAGETTRFTASQAAEALYNLASAGLDATESVEALDGVLSLAAATGSDLATSSSTVTAALSQYSLDAKEATTVSNVFAAAIANSQANMEKLGSAFRQVGPVAGALGISLEETTGALQALFDAGFRGEQAGTVLRNILSQLADVTGPASEKLAALGIDMASIDPSANSLIDVLGTLAEANLTAGEAINAFGTEAGPGLLQLLKTGREGLQDYTDAVTGTNAANEQAEIQMDTLQGDIDELNSALEGLAIGVGEGLNPLLRFLVDTLTDIVLAVNAVPDPIKAMTLVFGGAVIAVNAAAAALGGLGIAINVALGPIALAIGAIGALATGIAALVGHNNDLKSQQMAEEFKDIAAAAGLTGEQLLGISREFAVFNVQGAASTKEILDLAKELGREFGKTPAQILQIAERYNGLNSDARDAIQTVLRQQETEQDLIASVTRYEQLRQQEKDAIAAKATQQAEQAEREADAIAEALRLERDRVKQVISDRIAALNETQRIEAVLQRQLEDRQITEEERNEALLAALEAEQQALYNLGYDARLVTKTWTDDNGRLVTGIQEGDKRLAEVNKRILETRDALGEAADTQDATQRAIRLAAVRAEAEIDAGQLTRDELIAIEDEIARIRDEKHQEELDRIEAEKQARIDAANFAANTILTGLSLVDEAFKISSEKRIAEINAQLQAQLEANDQELRSSLAAIDEELRATLEAQGLAEETKIERLTREVEELNASLEEETDAKKKAAIQEKIVETKKELDRTKIQEDFAKKREKIEADLAAEKLAIEKDFQKQKAQAEYDAALASWTIQLLSAGAQAAQGVLNAFVSTLAIPIVGPALAPAAAIAAGIFGAAQVGIVAAQKPEPPSFQTGGIVPGRQFSGDNVQANVNSGEMILTREQQGALFDMIANGGGGRGPQTMTQIFEIDGRVLSEVVAEYIDQGKTRLKVLSRR